MFHNQNKFIKIKIFSYLSLRELLNIRFLNKYYNEFIKKSIWPHEVKPGKYTEEVLLNFNFENFHLYNCEIRDNFLKLMKNCKSLKITYSKITDQSLSYLMDIEKLNLLHSEIYDKHIIPQNNSILENNILENNILENNNIKYLNLMLTHISKETVFFLSKYYKNFGENGLEYLNLGGTRITDEAVVFFANNCIFKTLKLKYNYITDISIYAILKNGHFKNLNLYGTVITDKGVTAIANSGLHFDKLNLSKTAITNKSAKLLTNCKHIKLFETKVTKEIVLFLIQNSVKVDYLF